MPSCSKRPNTNWAPRADPDGLLRIAVSAGYYRIPRLLNLKQLAARLNVTSASISERLRRAEGRVVVQYVTRGGRSPWDEQTLFDATDVEAGEADWPEALAGSLAEDPPATQ